MRMLIMGLLCNAALVAGSAWAEDVKDSNACNGVEWDDNRAMVVAKVTAVPRVNFVKGAHDDPSGPGETCPAPGDGCRKESYLVTGDLVLVGRARGEFTCVAYQAPLTRTQAWTTGWLPSAALTAVEPTLSPKPLDWIGAWRQPGGHVEIASAEGGKLKVEGEMTVPTAAGDFQNGDFRTEVASQKTLTFTDEGNYGDGCRVRMQRVGSLLLVEDNGGCGGAGVTFTGLYRRQS